jgi:hypothetical protein
MNNDKWEELYLLATTEVSGKRMAERIFTVRSAIQERLQDLAQSSDHHAERKKMETALKSLDTLEIESREW